MLSYRHGFHAGNHADVLKHAVAVFLARYLQQKPGGVLFVDTHAGAGLYDLAAPMAAKTAEWEDGVAPVLAQSGEAPALLRDWLALVRARNPDGALTVYPGSAALLATLRRPQDRVVLYELHTTDHAAVAAQMRRESRVAVGKADGFAALQALLPPPESRTLVLIDPSYEMKSDYETVVAALAGAWRKFPTGVYALWLPVIERARTEAALAAIAAAGLRKVFRIEFCVVPDGAQRGLTGSQMLVV
ncbi:MAG: 23S rRNA (adenine(2030)-N(6))-methyltransferase RlmJ, partial [Alphaproteobacteria bacterium]|nr:23S rRNA (adenine(2030)-N(6))-methyltransferase RlmJ [Alphaproteobacteria bacterium]